MIALGKAQKNQCMKVIISKVFRLIASFSLSLVLSSCAIYSTNFNCPGGRGARCAMLSDVDKKVTSGEIETVYFDKKCKSGRCREVKDTPEQQLNTHQAKTEFLEPEASSYQEVFTDAD